VQSTTDNKTSQSGNGELDAIEGKRVYNPDTGQYEVVKDVTGELEEVRSYRFVGKWADFT